MSPQRAKLEAAYVPLSRCCRDTGFIPKQVWERLDAVVSRGLALDPDRRFASDTEWLSALQQVKLAMQLPDAATTPLDNRLTRLLDWTERVWTGKSAHSPPSENR